MITRLAAKTEQIRKTISRNDEILKNEIQAIDSDLDADAYDRRDAFNRLRYDCDRFLQKKAEKVQQELEEVSQGQQRNDAKQQKQLNGLSRDLYRLKANLLGVHWCWARMVNVDREDPSKVMELEAPEPPPVKA